MADRQKHMLSKVMKNKEIIITKHFKLCSISNRVRDHCGITSVILNFSESRNNNEDIFGPFVASQVNELVCTSFQMRAWSCITSYPLQSYPYLAYDNVNLAMVISMMLRSSMPAFQGRHHRGATAPLKVSKKEKN